MHGTRALITDKRATNRQKGNRKAFIYYTWLWKEKQLRTISKGMSKSNGWKPCADFIIKDVLLIALASVAQLVGHCPTSWEIFGLILVTGSIPQSGHMPRLWVRICTISQPTNLSLPLSPPPFSKSQQACLWVRIKNTLIAVSVCVCIHIKISWKLCNTLEKSFHQNEFNKNICHVKGLGLRYQNKSLWTTSLPSPPGSMRLYSTRGIQKNPGTSLIKNCVCFLHV